MDVSGHEGEIPIPITSRYVVHHHIPNPQTRPPLHKTEDITPFFTPNSCNKIVGEVGPPKVVKYRECLKNHAASMGGNATDGCGEFMPSGDEGTLEAFKCSACSCHRNFHRKVVQGEFAYSFGYIHRPHPPALIMPLGAIHTTSESEEIEEEAGFVVGGGVGGGTTTTPLMVKKRRFRTKFTQEQKEKMLVFADKFGWKLPRQDEGLVQSFCQEIGVKRRVLKVWMHNNKHSLGKKTPPQSQCD